MRILVLGGYGLVGSDLMRGLAGAGHEVIGFGRSMALGERLLPQFSWVSGDLGRMREPNDWVRALDGVEAVVNAAGALQGGSRDNLTDVHLTGVRAAVLACEAAGVRHWVQVSAPGAKMDADTDFMRTKAMGDEFVRESQLNWTILKPGLVISANAYGGTTLVRMLAAFPIVQPIAYGNSPVQTISSAQLSDAVLEVLSGQVFSCRDYELAEGEPHTLSETVAAFREWTGRPSAKALVDIPNWLAGLVARGADIAGWLGWRSPLRTNALRVLKSGVVCDTSAWENAGGREFSSLADTLQSMPATAQERIFGRAQLVYPIALLTLALFWLASGIIGAAQVEAAKVVLTGSFAEPLAGGLVWGGVAVDCLIGMALLKRPWTRIAAWASIGVGLVYLGMGTWLTPDLWSDPLGPFVKVLPALSLGLVVAALTEER